ncbi:MAG: DUF5777 family beta-barrel protein [Chitinophagaceae bacterium]
MKKIYSYSISILVLITSVNKTIAQTDSTKKVDLFADIDNEAKATTAANIDYATATFKSTRVINSQSIETIGKHNLDFRISHRFGYLNSGAYNLFGLDNATMMMNFDYGLTNNLLVGVGRSTVNKEYSAYAKYKFLKQSTGKVNMPITMAYLFSAMHYTQKTTEDISFTNRTSYAHQLLIARKFSDNISLQLMPTLVHINLVDFSKEDNNLFSLGVGGRVKISKRVAINAEYFHQFNQLTGTTNSLSIGFDIETGGHVFQLHFTNSTGMTERAFITNTTGDWGNGDIHFGFNISRLFTLKKSAGSRSSW